LDVQLTLQPLQVPGVRLPPLPRTARPALLDRVARLVRPVQMTIWHVDSRHPVGRFQYKSSAR